MFTGIVEEDWGMVVADKAQDAKKNPKKTNSLQVLFFLYFIV